jgi:hypothetical protein
VHLNNGQTPHEEMAERFAESAPAFMLGRLIAAEDYRASQRAYRNRIAQAEAATWQAMGNDELAVQALKAVEEDMAGDISIRGDTHNHFVAPAQQQPTPAPTPTPPATSTVTDWLKPALIGAALLGTGGGSVALWDYFNNETTTQPATDVDQDWKFGIQVRDRE